MSLSRCSLSFIVKLVIILLITLLQNINANVSPFDPSTINLVIKNKTPAIFLLTVHNTHTKDNTKSTNNDKNQQNILYQFHKAAELYYEIHPEKIPELGKKASDMLLFVVSDPNDGLFTFQKITEYLGVYPQQDPKVVYLSHSHQKYLLNQNIFITSQSVVQFLSRIQRKQESIFYKTQSIAEFQKRSSKDRFVKTLIRLNFNQIVYSSQKQYLVLFYSPLNYKSRVLKVQFQKAAQSIRKNTNIIFAKVNAVKNQIIIQAQSQKVLISEDKAPTIIYFRKNKNQLPLHYKQLKQYQGTYDYILKWIKQNTGYQWARPEKVSEQVYQQQL